MEYEGIKNLLKSLHAVEGWYGSGLLREVLLTRWRKRVERQVQLEHIHTRVAQDPERWQIGVLRNQRLDLADRQASRLGNTRRLQARVCWGDMRIEAAGGSSHCIAGNGSIRCQAILNTIIRNVNRDCIPQLLRCRSQVAAARTCRIVTVACGRRARVEIFLA